MPFKYFWSEVYVYMSQPFRNDELFFMLRAHCFLFIRLENDFVAHYVNVSVLIKFSQRSVFLP